MSELTLQCRFPARNEAVIDPEIGSEQHALGCRAQVLERAELDFDLAGFRHRCIGAVKWTIGLDIPGPANQRRGSQRRHASGRLHKAGWNTQIAAGSCDVARTATKSRSSSGTNNDVRAPGTVGTRASRR